MTIIRLTLTESLGRRYGNIHVSYHINKTTADSYAKEQIEKGFDVTHDCGEYRTRKTHYTYKTKYKLTKIFVNE